MIQACLYCGHEFDDAESEQLSGYCSKHCRRAARVMSSLDVKVDWFAIQLRTFLVRDSWPDSELQQRARSECGRNPRNGRGERC